MTEETSELKFLPSPIPEGYRYYNIHTDMERRKRSQRCMRMLRQLDATDPADEEACRALLVDLLGGIGAGSRIVGGFFCDYGDEIHIGRDTFINTNCTMLDGGGISIGDHVLIAPSVQLYSVGHPLDQAERAAGWEFGLPIRIESHAWIGGNATICPGVTIGAGAVIGAGSVVTRDIPPRTLAAGNPCRVMRSI